MYEFIVILNLSRLRDSCVEQARGGERNHQVGAEEENNDSSGNVEKTDGRMYT